jgi:hypothetical protein
MRGEVAYGYNADSRVAQMSTGGSGSTDLGTLAYAYDADGRRTAVGRPLAAVNLPAPAASMLEYQLSKPQHKSPRSIRTGKYLGRL